MDRETKYQRLRDDLYKASVRGDLRKIARSLEEGANVNWRDSATNEWTALHRACFQKRPDIVKVLLWYNPDVNQKTTIGETALHWACRCGCIICVKLLLATGECDLGILNWYGCSPVGNAVYFGKVDIVKYFVTNCKVNLSGNHLLLACKQGHSSVVKYMLSDLCMNPNIRQPDGTTPLTLAKNKEVIKVLLEHGAVAEDTYFQQLGKISKDPLKIAVKVFVIGSGGEGKSTFVEAIEHEPTKLTPLVSAFVQPKEVEGVCQRTAGIIPRVFKSRLYGHVLYYDFAGQEAYYSSHAAIINATVHTCAPVFVLVIGFHRDDSTITQSTTYWLGIIANQFSDLNCKAPLIVVGSHVDCVKQSLEVERKMNTILQAIEEYSKFFELLKIVPVDCRYSKSDGMTSLRRCMRTACESVRSKITISLSAHMFLIYLLDNHSNDLVLTLDDVHTNLVTAQEVVQKHKQILPYIPTTISRLFEICVQLSDSGHILFLINKSVIENSYIVIDNTALLSKINGTMFAPENFKQHCNFSTSTGIVPRSKLKRFFPNYSVEMLTKYLSYLELAVPIDDREVLGLIDHHLEISDDLLSKDVYLFCPALIRLEAPPNVWECSYPPLLNFSWSIQCIEDHQFLDARFQHVLLLRLALSINKTPIAEARHNSDLHCLVWKTGVCWSTAEGAKILVEVIDKKSVCILYQACVLSPEIFKLRSSVINKVLAAVSEFCPTVATRETLIVNEKPYPKLSTFPVNYIMAYPINFSKVTALSINSIAHSIVLDRPCVVHGTEMHLLNELLPIEVYANIGENMLQALFNEKSSVYTSKISSRYLSAVSAIWSKNPDLADIIRSVLTEKSPGTRHKKNLEEVLKSWRDGCDGTYKSLRKILDQLSMFAGRCPLKLAGVQCTDFDEELLPKVEPIAEDSAIEELMREYDVTDKQLNTKIREEDIYDLAGYFDCVETYLDKLGLTAGQQTDVKDLAFRCNTKIAMLEALKLWRQPKPWLATYRTLLQILLDLKRGDVAVSVCQYIKEEIPRQKMTE